MSTAVAPRQAEKAGIRKVDVRFLEAFGGKMLEQLTAEQQSQFLMALGNHIGVRAELGELILYQGKPYVTREGRLRNAHRSGLLGGITVRPATSNERRDYGAAGDDVIWTAQVFRRGATRPYVGWGRVGKGDRNAVSKTHPGEMAKKRATYDALRLAFPLAEEITDLHRHYIEEAEAAAQKGRVDVHPVIAATYDMDDADDATGDVTGDEAAAADAAPSAAAPEAPTRVVEPGAPATEEQIAKILDLADAPANAAHRAHILERLSKPGLKEKVAAAWIVALQSVTSGPVPAGQVADELALGDPRGTDAVRSGR